ncbi:unnamed protein product [Paramecium pentaurelia]|uniref:Uncharacterized protein n=1 Tax=Paramecium pentaurelia TaxID=43138 RepID=A0A8S1VGJ8_9CILI|nr:unnamed protein product [Paramecium pentaurelia]
MTTEQLSSNKKTWAELAEEEDDEIENGQFTTNSETLDRNEIPYQPTLTKSISEFQPKTRNDRQKNYKQRDNDGSGLKNYQQNNSHFNKGNNKQNRQTKSNYDEVYNILFETTNQEILLKVKPMNRNENLETVKEYFEKQYQNIKAFPRNDINQIDLLISPKIGLYILEDHRFKAQIGDSILTIHYPQFPNEPLSEYYAKKRYLEKEKKIIQPALVFQRNAISSKVNDQNDYNEKSENGIKQDINNYDKIENDQPQIYKEKDNLEDQQYEQKNPQYKGKQDKKDFNKQINYKNKKYNNNNNYNDYEEDFREQKDEKQINNKSNKYRNEQNQPKENYQSQKYYQYDNYKYTDKTTSDNNLVPYQEKEQYKDYRNNQNYQNYNTTNNNYNYNQKRQLKGNNKQKNDQYVIYEEKQKSNSDEITKNVTTNTHDNFDKQVEVSQNINQPIQQKDVNEDQNEDIPIDSENEQGQEQEQIEENKTPNKNKKKKKNKKNLKSLKPNDTNFFGILQSGTK